MQLKGTLLPLLLSTTVVLSIPTNKRDTSKVLLDLSTITNNTVLLSSDLASFITNSSTIEPFAQHFTDLRQSIDVTATDVNAAGSFNSTNSQAIASQAGDFAQAGLNLLITLMNNETFMASAGQKSHVFYNLNATSTATLDLFTALENAVDLDSFASLSASQEQLSAAFTDAINDYS